jgi:hypothetical protein
LFHFICFLIRDKYTDKNSRTQRFRDSKIGRVFAGRIKKIAPIRSVRVVCVPEKAETAVSTPKVNEKYLETAVSTPKVNEKYPETAVSTPKVNGKCPETAVSAFGAAFFALKSMRVNKTQIIKWIIICVFLFNLRICAPNYCSGSLFFFFSF